MENLIEQDHTIEPPMMFTFKYFFRCAALLVVCTTFAACAQEKPSNKLDVVAKYEKMRKKTKQGHTHVEYCDDGIVKLTISSRGQLNSRELYLPRKSIVYLKNRDTLNTYPLGVQIASDCFSQTKDRDCATNSIVWGINVALFDTAERRMKNAIKFDQMETTDDIVEGLFVSKVNEDAIKKAEKYKIGDARRHHFYRKDDIIYTNFSPASSDKKDNLPTLYIKLNSYKFLRPDYKRCEWMIFTNEGIRTSRASNCTDLSNWRTFVSDFDKISEKISADGEFAKTCNP